MGYTVLQSRTQRSDFRFTSVTYGLQPVRLLCPWDSPGKNTGEGCIFSSRGSSLPGDGTSISYLAGRFFTAEPPGELWACRQAQSLQSCLTLYNPKDCSPPGFSVHGILQGRIILSMLSSRDLPDTGTEPASLISPELAGMFFTTSAIWKAQRYV